MRVACALAAVAMAALLAACEVVTGSTNGYTPKPVEAGLSGACLSAKNCDGGVGSAVCCLVVTTTGAGTTCSAPPLCPALPGSLPVQLCLGSAECPDASCTAQQCYWTGEAIPVLACGALPDCTPL
jgi:hypothetical protein